MAALGDNFSTEQRRDYVIASMSIGIILSTVTLVARLWARKSIINQLRIEDWLMVAGTILSYGTAICMLWGVLVTGLHIPFSSLPLDKISGNLLMIWIIQKLQPPTLFCIKASMLIFHSHIFQSRGFRAASWAVGIMTSLWMIASILGTTFQCTPVSFFWDKKQPGGTCLIGAVHKIGLSSGVLSTVGDIVIYLMPILPLTKLRIDKKTKLGLIGLFTLGLFTVIASILRWVAIINSHSVTALNSSQVQVGIWTYLEMSLGVVCGNLPFLAPMLGCVGPRKRSYYPTKRSRQEQFAGRALGSGPPEATQGEQESVPQTRPRPLSGAPVLPNIVEVQAMDSNGKIKVQSDGFTRLYNDSDDSDIELGVWGAMPEEKR
ncbi:hypothetical protein MFIFM68171_06659 [Madurella fahalii]|uniref:Rhodopsin domain-containing protein n=1 Tax=Madurella fahalii TaxID=1157608 RepID=A0ABQ0GFA7_9PEZI